MTWVKSSFSQGASNCAEVTTMSAAQATAMWRGWSLIEKLRDKGVGAKDQVVVVKDSSQDDVVLVFTQAEWAAFAAGMKAGEFDLDGRG